MKTDFPQQNTDREGLEIYNKYAVWMLNNECAYLALPGILISIRFYPAESGLSKKYQNAFVINVEHDYKNPDMLHSFDYDNHTGTYGYTLFSKTMEGAMIKAEQFIKEPFEGVREFHSRKIVSTTKLPIKEVAKYAFLHHSAMFPDLLKDSFKREALESHISTYVEYMEHARIYESRRQADAKYQKKLEKVFLKSFGFSVHGCVHQWKFNFENFQRLAKVKQIKDLPKFKQKLTRKVYQYFNV